jgi:hypothetical protein
MRPAGNGVVSVAVPGGSLAIELITSAATAALIRAALARNSHAGG